LADTDDTEARARRVILAAVMRDDDALNNILNEACCWELALTLGQLAAGMLVARYGRAEAVRFATEDALYWLDRAAP
jgi:hypothetical protein